jgi:hypothetical protein
MFATFTLTDANPKLAIPRKICWRERMIQGKMARIYVVYNVILSASYSLSQIRTSIIPIKSLFHSKG